MIRRILDPDPRTRITLAEIKQDEWFKQKYTPTNPDEDGEDVSVDDEVLTIHEVMIHSEVTSDHSYFAVYFDQY